ncbi:MAG: prohead protein [Phage 65_10]|nr:MAG: prohead protein [Phage 65_10]
MSAKTKDIPVQTREASFVPASFNETDNTVDVVWTTGSRRRAYDYWNGTYYDEELEVSTASVDMTRFDAGVVQVLDGHNTYGGVRAILGIATTASIKSGEGRATLKLSTNPDNAGIVGDIKAGVIRSVSFGYSVQKYEVTDSKARKDGGTVPLYRATRWTPSEISFVSVPADPNASTRSDETAGQAAPCEFVFTRAEAPTNPLESTMTEEEKRAAAEAEATRLQAEQAERTRQAAETARTAEANRAAALTDLCVRHGVTSLAPAFIRDGLTVEAAGTKVLEELARQDAARGGHVTGSRITNGTGSEHETRMNGMLEAVRARVDVAAGREVTDNGRRFRHLTLLEMGREMLDGLGHSTRHMSKMEVASLMFNVRHAAQTRSGGMMTVSDFPSLMANVANKRLRNGYEENPGTYRRWARQAPSLPDFKNVQVTQVSAMPDLLQVNEHGEFKYGSLSDGAVTYGLSTFGLIVALTRQAIVNDDLRAFDRMVTGFGGAAARLENRTVYAQLTANANLPDGGALFNATAVTTAGGHANLTSTGTVINIDNLSIGRKAMRKQKGLQSEELNLAPSFLIVPTDLEQVAYQYTSAQYTPATAATINEFRSGGRTALDPIVEPILDANSATAWYLAANNGQVDTVEFAYLDGADGPVIESEMGFEVDGMSLKCRLDFVAKPIDFRGLYKNNGA